MSAVIWFKKCYIKLKGEKFNDILHSLKNFYYRYSLFFVVPAFAKEKKKFKK